ncbi:MAG TPA: molybdenum cofactor guanylyltransferase [Steroidobacteraceae bacterium]|nr:molybdenum cofactor guanylyltransferase [Steroidobacteraceae bacterium]
MQASSTLVGVVIAGGRSLRFGGEKAVAPFAGRPLLLWAVERLGRVCSRVAVNARPGTEAAALTQSLGLQLLHDAPGDPDGPLSGVKAGLQWAREAGAAALAVCPCDVPLLPNDLHERLLAAAGHGAGHGAAMAETTEGRQPMCAIWPASALEVVTAALAAGEHPPTWRLLEQLGAAKVRFDATGAFSNLNTREDLERLETLYYQRQNSATKPDG